jgi:hypothetical protein
MDALFASFLCKDNTRKSEIQVKKIKKMKKTAENCVFFTFFDENP